MYELEITSVLCCFYFASVNWSVLQKKHKQCETKTLSKSIIEINAAYAGANEGHGEDGDGVHQTANDVTMDVNDVGGGVMQHGVQVWARVEIGDRGWLDAGVKRK